MNNKKLNEELDRIYEVISNVEKKDKKKLITEAIDLTELGRKIYREFFDDGKAVQQLDNRGNPISRWKIGDQVIDRFDYDWLTNNLKISGPDWVKTIPQELAQKLGKILLKIDPTYVSKLYNAALEAIYAKSRVMKNKADFYRAIKAMKEADPTKTTLDCLEEIFGDRVTASMFEEEVDKALNSFNEIIDRATKKMTYKQWLDRLGQFFPNFIRYHADVYIPWITRRLSKIDEEIQATLDKIARKKLNKIEGGITDKYDKDIEHLINLIVAHKQSFYQDISGMFRKYLTDNNIFVDDEVFKQIMEHPQTKQMLEQASATAQESVGRTSTKSIKGFFDLFRFLRYGKADLMSTQWSKLANFIIVKTPLTWREMRAITADAGVTSHFIDKLVGTAVINYGLIPLVKSVYETAVPNAAEEQYQKQMQSLYNEMCNVAQPYMTPAECTQLKIETTREVYTKEKFWETFKDNLPVNFDRGWKENLLGQTYIDDVMALGSMVLGNTSWDSWNDLIYDEEVQRVGNMLERYGWDPNADFETNMRNVTNKVKQTAQTNPQQVENDDNSLGGDMGGPEPEPQPQTEVELTDLEAQRIGFPKGVLEPSMSDDPNAKFFKVSDTEVIISYKGQRDKVTKRGNEWLYDDGTNIFTDEDNQEVDTNNNEEETTGGGVNVNDSYKNPKKLINQVNPKTLKESIRKKILLKHEDKKIKVRKINENLRKFEEHLYYGNYEKFFSKMFKLAESYKKSKLYLNEDDNAAFDEALLKSGLFVGQGDRIKKELSNYISTKLELKGEIKTKFEEKIMGYPFDNIGELFTDTNKIVDIIYESFIESLPSSSEQSTNFMTALQSTIKPYLKTADFERNFKSSLKDLSSPIMDNTKKKFNDLVDKIKELLAKEDSKS